MLKVIFWKPSLLSILILCLPILVKAEPGEQKKMVADDISTTLLQQKLNVYHTFYLEQLMESPEERIEFISKIYENQKLEEIAVSRGLDQSQPVLESLYVARKRILLKALVQDEFSKLNENLNALAKERYLADPSQYRLRKKIKIATIFIGFKDLNAKSKLTDILNQLKAKPEDDKIFHDLARENSMDRMAEKGGINHKWLIAPFNLKNKSKIMQAAFALTKKGELTDVIETDQGFSIIKLIKTTPSVQASFESVKKQIVEQIQSDLFRNKQAEVVRSLQAEGDMSINEDLLKKIIAKAYRSRISN